MWMTFLEMKAAYGLTLARRVSARVRGVVIAGEQCWSSVHVQDVRNGVL
jgi:hypothetical protein